jgi:hypothetical protein
MSQLVETAPDTKRTRRRRNLIVAGVIAALIVMALLTGLPQRLALEYGLRKTLETDVHVRGLSLVPRVHIAELRIAGEPGSAPVTLQGVDIAYSLSVESGVKVLAVRIDSAAVDYQQYADGTTNFAFLERLMDRDSPPESTGETPNLSPYIPRTFDIGDLTLAVASPGGAIELGGLQLDATLESLLAMTARVHGGDMRGTLRISESGEERPLAGTLDVEYRSNMPSMGITVKANIPDVVTLDAKTHLITALGTTAAQVRIDEARLMDDEWTVILPTPFAFNSLDLSGTEFTVSSPPGVPWNLAADVRVDGRGIRYGEPGHEWFDGDLQVSGAYDGERGEFEAVLNRGQRLSVIASGEPADAHIAATVIDWNRADLVDALPKDFRALLDELPHLEQIGASAEVQIQWPDYIVNASVDPLFTRDAGSSEKFALRVEGEGTRDITREDLFHGSLRATLGKGELSAAVDADTSSRYSADLSLATVDLARWLTPVQQRIPITLPPGTVDGTVSVRNDSKFRVETDLVLRPAAMNSPVTVSGTAESQSQEGLLPISGMAKVTFPDAEPTGAADLQFALSEAFALSLKGSLTTVELASAAVLAGLNELPGGVAAILSGQADVARTPESFSVALNLDAAPATLAGVVFPAEQPLHIEGTLTGPASMSSLHSRSIALRFTEDAALDIAALNLAFTPFEIKGHVTGKVDFDYVGPLIGMPTVVGALTIDAPLTIDGSTVEGQIHLEGDGFGYGSWAGPYGTPVVLNGFTRYDIAGQTAQLDTVDATWGEGSRLTSTQLAVALEPFSLSGPFSVTTDLTPLVDLRFLDAATGTANASGTLGVGPERTTEVEYELAATSLTLSGALAAFGGLSSTGSIAYGESLNGHVRFAAADAAAAGAMLHDPRGECTIENGVAVAKGVEASIYEGRIVADAEVNLLDTAAGGTLNAHLEGVDLDRFTKEYEPPSVVLTGIASGDVSLVWNADGMRDLRVDLASNEGFSMNREVIENLLLQSLTAGVTGMKKLNRRIQEETIGAAPQRPFESAAVSLSLEGDTYAEQRLVGPIALKSKMLNLSIDLGVDLMAIASAMELQQQAQLGEGDTISAEPVQWSLPDETPNPQSNISDAQSSNSAKEEES